MTILPTDLDDPCYHDDDAARAMFEKIRWPQGSDLPDMRQDRYVVPAWRRIDGAGLVLVQRLPMKFTVRVGLV